jgi:AcrR family transcriptional regulator
MSETHTHDVPRLGKNSTNSHVEILDAAAECFMEQGFHATSIDDISRRLGSTKGRIYHHHRSKTDLFFEVYREGMRRNFEAVRQVMRGPGNGAERLLSMLIRHALSMMENLTYETVVVHGVHMHRMAATTPAQRRALNELMMIRNDFEGLFKSVAYEGVDDGSLAIPDVFVSIKAALGALNWISVWYRPRLGETSVDREFLAEKLVDTMMYGLVGKVADPDSSSQRTS